MKRLLRSVIDFDGGLPSDALAANFQKLFSSGVDWTRSDDESVYKFVLTYFQQRLELPSGQTVTDFFTKKNDIEAVERLKDIGAAATYRSSNFLHLLEEIRGEQNRLKMVAILKEANEIVTKGMTIEKQHVFGVRDAVNHFMEKAHDLIVPENNIRNEGDIRDDSKLVKDEYLTSKLNKDRAWGRFTGLTAIDTVCHGIKKGELWVHAGYAGEMKTSFATNWCYNLVTRYRSNVLYYSLEMRYEHIRRIMYVLHSTNAKWRALGYKPLDYRRVRDGELTPEEESFWLAVIDDFAKNPEYCSYHLWAPDNDIDVSAIRMKAELEHRQMEVGMLVIDHGGLVEARKLKKNKDYTIELNSVIRDAKKLALQFNHGEGIPVLLLFQINRQGKEEADKNEGRYKLKALAQSNECERSADVVTTTYLNEEHRKNGTSLFCCLKNRDNPLFEPFMVDVDFTCRRMYNRDPFQGADGRGISVDDQRQVMDVMWGV